MHQIYFPSIACDGGVAGATERTDGVVDTQIDLALQKKGVFSKEKAMTFHFCLLFLFRFCYPL